MYQESDKGLIQTPQKMLKAGGVDPSERVRLIPAHIAKVCPLVDMLQFGFAISRRIINAIVDNPELVEIGIDVDTRHHAHPFNDPVGISASLPPHQIHFEREILIHDGVIKHQVAAGGLLHLAFHILLYQVRRNFSPAR